MSKINVSREVRWKAVRSSGKGGQHVNKVSTKVEAFFNIRASKLLSEVQKQRIYSKLKNKINSEGTLVISCQEKRSQLLNRQKAFTKINKLINNALIIQKARKASKPTKSMIEKRLKQKQKQSQKKELRRKVSLD